MSQAVEAHLAHAYSGVISKIIASLTNVEILSFTGSD